MLKVSSLRKFQGQRTRADKPLLLQTPLYLRVTTSWDLSHKASKTSPSGNGPGVRGTPGVQPPPTPGLSSPSRHPGCGLGPLHARAAPRHPARPSWPPSILPVGGRGPRSPGRLETAKALRVTPSGRFAEGPRPRRGNSPLARVPPRVAAPLLSSPPPPQPWQRTAPNGSLPARSHRPRGKPPRPPAMPGAPSGAARPRPAPPSPGGTPAPRPSPRRPRGPGAAAPLRRRRARSPPCPAESGAPDQNGGGRSGTGREWAVLRGEDGGGGGERLPEVRRHGEPRGEGGLWGGPGSLSRRPVGRGETADAPAAGFPWAGAGYAPRRAGSVPRRLRAGSSRARLVAPSPQLRRCGGAGVQAPAAPRGLPPRGAALLLPPLPRAAGRARPAAVPGPRRRQRPRLCPFSPSGPAVTPPSPPRSAPCPAGVVWSSGPGRQRPRRRSPRNPRAGCWSRLPQESVRDRASAPAAAVLPLCPARARATALARCGPRGCRLCTRPFGPSLGSSCGLEIAAALGCGASSCSAPRRCYRGVPGETWRALEMMCVLVPLECSCCRLG